MSDDQHFNGDPEMAERLSRMIDFDRQGIPLPPEAISDIRVGGAEQALQSEVHKSKEEKDADGFNFMYDGRKHLWLYRAPDARGPGTKYDEPNYYERIPQAWKDEWKDKEITRADWFPKGAPRRLDPDLRKLLLSCNPRFDKLIAHKGFWLYCEQARRWGPDANKLESFQNMSDRDTYTAQEFGRVLKNKLYGLDNYISIKDETMDGGRRWYKASAPQALLAYLKDCGFSFILLKGRQAAITSTMMAIAVLSALVKTSYKGAIVVDKEKTGLGIFNDKFKSTYQHLPIWWRVESKGMPWSDKRVVFDFDPGGSKSEKRKFSSEMSVYPSTDEQTLNSNSPTEVYFDEAQKIPKLQEILKEIKPTMRAGTSEGLTVRRAAYIWGTGGTGDVGKGAYEGEFRGAMKRVEDPTKDRVFLIPIFFDAFCRPYMDEWIFKDEYEDYMDGDRDYLKGMSAEENQAVFSAHYPLYVDDSFMASTKTIVPQSFIKRNKDRIFTQCHSDPILRPVKGYFEPMFDMARPMDPGSVLPHRLIGSTFRVAPEEDFYAPATMYLPHNPLTGADNSFIDRYYQGTDPIQADAGLSNMASVILDTAGVVEGVGNEKIYRPTVACTINHRAKDVKETFLQCVLMGMYYRNYQERKCPEVIEYEQGHNYIDYQKQPAIDTEMSMMLRAYLEPRYAGGGHTVGVSMKKDRKSRGHADLASYLYDYGEDLWHIEIWNQISTIHTLERPDGTIQWGTKDPLASKDDLVMALLNSVIGWRSVGRKPRSTTDDNVLIYRRTRVPSRDALGHVSYIEKIEKIQYAAA